MSWSGRGQSGSSWGTATPFRTREYRSPSMPTSPVKKRSCCGSTASSTSRTTTTAPEEGRAALSRLDHGGRPGRVDAVPPLQPAARHARPSRLPGARGGSRYGRLGARSRRAWRSRPDDGPRRPRHGEIHAGDRSLPGRRPGPVRAGVQPEGPRRRHLRSRRRERTRGGPSGHRLLRDGRPLPLRPARQEPALLPGHDGSTPTRCGGAWTCSRAASWRRCSSAPAIPTTRRGSIPRW